MAKPVDTTAEQNARFSNMSSEAWVGEGSADWNGPNVKKIGGLPHWCHPRRTRGAPVVLRFCGPVVLPWCLRGAPESSLEWPKGGVSCGAPVVLPSGTQGCSRGAPAVFPSGSPLPMASPHRTPGCFVVLSLVLSPARRPACQLVLRLVIQLAL